MKIIGVLGRARSGKDTISGILIQELQSKGLNYKVVRLASPIKEAATALFGFTHEQLEGPSKEMIDPVWNITPRSVFQKITDTTMKEMGVQFFTKRLYQKYDASCESEKYIIIPDVRYPHDIEEIHKRGGLVIKVCRNDTNIIRHDCENSIDTLEGDVNINNSGTITDLHDQIRAVLIKSQST
jgi:hypothetical protein